MPERPDDNLEDMLSQLASAHQETAEQIESLMSRPASEPAEAVPAGETKLPGEVEGPAAEEALAMAVQVDSPGSAGRSEEEIVAALASEAEGATGVAVQEQTEPEPAAQAWIEPDAAAPAVERPRRRPAPVKAKSNPTAAMGFFIPIIFLFGLLTLLPAILGVLILMGADVPLAGREDSKTMALVMLACWPVSLGLLAGGVWYLIQYNKAKRKLAEDSPRHVRGKAL